MYLKQQSGIYQDHLIRPEDNVYFLLRLTREGGRGISWAGKSDLQNGVQDHQNPPAATHGCTYSLDTSPSCLHNLFLLLCPHRANADGE